MNIRQLDLTACRTPLKALRYILLCLAAAIVGLHTSSVFADAGCPWVNASNAQGTGAVDTHAQYRSAVLPTGKDTGTGLMISGSYPQLRFFNFTLYHKGKLVDHLADSDILPLQGGPANPNVAAIPYSNNYTDTYQISIKYADVPAAREPNTLYAGPKDSTAALLLMRNYQPNSGADEYGNVSLPQLAVLNSDGSSTRWDDVNSFRCPLLNLLDGVLGPLPLPILHVAPKDPVFNVIPVTAYDGVPLSKGGYINFDSGYAEGFVSTSSKADLVIVRARMAATPSSQANPSQMQARYVSLCEYKKENLLAVSCTDDSETVIQSDGYSNYVLSEDGDVPVDATQAHGYNWMPSLKPAQVSVLVLRQILATPDFPGNYQVAGASSDPIAALGSWAPQITYCDSATFNNNALQGGAALFSACQVAYQAKINK